MADREPLSDQPLGADDAIPAPWAEARGRLEEAGTYWLATARPDGRPHVMPVLGAWLDGALSFSAGEASRKGKNLARPALRHHGGQPCPGSRGRRRSREGERQGHATPRGRGVRVQIRVAT